MSRFATTLLGGLLALICLTGASPAARAATPLRALQYTSDITVTLGGTTVAPSDVVEDDLAGMVTPVDIGMLPADAHVDAYHALPNGDALLSFDTTVMLPDGDIAGPADIVRFIGTGYVLVIDAAARGIPEGTDVDAVTISDGALLVSFDTAVQLSGNVFEDEDLVEITGMVPPFAPFFSGSAAGVPPDLDLDGAHALSPTRLLLSFDGSGSIDGVAFDDEDVLEYDSVAGSWELAYDGSAHHEGWQDADLIALDGLPIEPSPTPSPTATAIVTATVATPTATAIVTGTVATPTATAIVTGTVATPTATAIITGTVATATATAVVTGTVATPTATAPPGVCVGDCDGNGMVTISELVTMVNIALDKQPVGNCLAGDANDNGLIAINEIVQAVNNALRGC